MAFQHHLGPASQSQSLSLSLPDDDSAATSREAIFTPVDAPRTSSMLGNTTAAAFAPPRKLRARRMRDDLSLSLPDLDDAPSSSLEPMCTPVDAVRVGGSSVGAVGSRSLAAFAPPRPVKRARNDGAAANACPPSQSQPMQQPSQSFLPDMSQDTLALFPRIIQTHVKKPRPSSIAKAALISTLNRATALHNPFLKGSDNDGTGATHANGGKQRSAANGHHKWGLSVAPPPSATLGMGLDDEGDAPDVPSPGEPREEERDILKKLLVSSSQPRKFSLDFEELGIAGEGDFSQVIKARARIDGVVYAVKRNKKPFTFDKMKLDALGEVFALAALQDHPSILRYHGAWLERRGEVLYIQTAFMSGGNVYAKYVDHGRKMPSNRLLVLARQIGGALEFMQRRGVLHNDIKPDNIFEEVDEHDVPRYVVGDFGLASSIHAASSTEGDSRYLCPEALSGNFGGERNDDSGTALFDSELDINSRDALDEEMASPRPAKRRRIDGGARPAADVFSLGASLYELATGNAIPRTGGIWYKLRSDHVAAAQDVLDACGSKVIADVVRECLVPDPSQRATCARVLRLLDHGAVQEDELQRLREENAALKKQNAETRACIRQLLSTGTKIPQSTVSKHRKRAGKACSKNHAPRRTPRRNVLSDSNR